MTNFGGRNDDVVVVIPMFNEASVIPDVVRSVRATFPRTICVDDGSTDGSAQLAEAAGAIVVRHPINLGQGAAIQTGIEFALSRSDVGYVVTFDADGQHQVADVVRMVDEARGGQVDVVLGSRFLTGGDEVPPARRVLLRCAVAFTRVTTGLKLTDAHNGLRVLNRRAAVTIRIRLSGMAHASEILEGIAESGLTYREYPVHVLYTDYSRGKGQSGINFVNILFDLMAARFRAVRP